MTENQPITPPPELVQQWKDNWVHGAPQDVGIQAWLVTRAANWGADAELDACCEWVTRWKSPSSADRLRRDRRPKPPCLAEQALDRLAWIDEKLEAPLLNHCNAIHTIRRALEKLQELEKGNE